MDDEPNGRPLVMERLRNAAPLVVIVVAAMIAIQMVPGAFRVVVFVAAIGLVIALRAWRPKDADRSYGPGSD